MNYLLYIVYYIYIYVYTYIRLYYYIYCILLHSSEELYILYTYKIKTIWTDKL